MFEKNIFIAPGSKEHINKSVIPFEVEKTKKLVSIQGLIPIYGIMDTLTDEERQRLEEIYPDKKIAMWGTRPGLRRVWESVKEGDIVIFYSENYYICTAEVAFKTINKKLAQKIWGKYKTGETWEYIFFVKNIRELNMHRRDFNKIAGYAENFIPQGFMRIRNDIARKRIFENIVAVHKPSRTTFSFTEKDFESCTGRKNDARYLAMRFKTLLNALKEKLDGELSEFTKSYVARPFNQGSKKYRQNMWLGLAHGKLEDKPQKCIQFQVSISPDDPFSIDIFIDRAGREMRKKVRSNIEKVRALFLEQIRQLKGYIIGYFTRQQRISFETDKMTEDDLDDFLQHMDSAGAHVYVSKIMSKEEVIKKGELIVDEIIKTWKELLPIYKLMAFGEHNRGLLKEILELIQKEPEYSNVIKVALAHLVAGKNLVFYGPPATSKTYLAKRICEHICGNDNFSFHTANAEWSYFDIVGGYILEGNQTIFKEGILLEATERCKGSIAETGRPCWLIIDELNRANLDLAFGKIFTQLDLDYRDRPLESIKKDGKLYEYFMPLSFRILATMNTYDRALLFSLGYAFMRRFAFIPLESLLREIESKEADSKMQITNDIKPFLEKETIKKLKEKTKEIVFNHFSKVAGEDKAFIFSELKIRDKSEVNKIIDKLKIDENFDVIDVFLYVANIITNEGLVEIGHAIVFDAAKFMIAYSLLFPDETNPKRLLDEAIVSYLLPQLEYFMPKLRRARIFGEERYKNSWERITKAIMNLNLPKTSKKLKEAEEGFKVIH